MFKPLKRKMRSDRDTGEPYITDIRTIIAENHFNIIDIFVKDNLSARAPTLSSN